MQSRRVFLSTIGWFPATALRWPLRQKLLPQCCGVNPWVDTKLRCKLQGRLQTWWSTKWRKIDAGEPGIFPFC